MSNSRAARAAEEWVKKYPVLLHMDVQEEKEWIFQEGVRWAVEEARIALSNPDPEDMWVIEFLEALLEDEGK